MMPLEAVLAVFQPHRVGRFRRRHLAEVERGRLPAGRTKDEKTTASYVPCRWVGDGEGERGRHRGVDRVAAIFQDIDADLGGDIALRDDHTVFRTGRRILGATLSRDREGHDPWKG